MYLRSVSLISGGGGGVSGGAITVPMASTGVVSPPCVTAPDAGGVTFFTFNIRVGDKSVNGGRPGEIMGLELWLDKTEEIFF